MIGRRFRLLVLLLGMLAIMARAGTALAQNSCPPGGFPIPQVTISDMSVVNNYPSNIDIEFTASSDRPGYFVIFVYEDNPLMPGMGMGRWSALGNRGSKTAICSSVGANRYRIEGTGIGFGSDIRYDPCYYPQGLDDFVTKPIDQTQGFIISYDVGDFCSNGSGVQCFYYMALANGISYRWEDMQGLHISPSSTTPSWSLPSSQGPCAVTSSYPLVRLTNDSIDQKTISVEGGRVVWSEVTNRYSDAEGHSLADVDIVVSYALAAMPSTVTRIQRTGLLDYGDPIFTIGIDGGRLVWGEQRTDGKHIYLYDLNAMTPQPTEPIASERLTSGNTYVDCVDIYGNYILVGGGIYNISLPPEDPAFFKPFVQMSCFSIFGNRIAVSASGIGLWENVLSDQPTFREIASTVTRTIWKNCVTIEGDNIVYVDDGNKIYLFNIVTGSRTLVATGCSPIVGMRAMDGGNIVFSDGGELYVVTAPLGTVDNCPDDPAKMEPGVCGCGNSDNGNTYYLDADGDGYGDQNNSVQACSLLAGYVDNGSDCNDADPQINPATKWYRDEDSDGYGKDEAVLLNETFEDGIADGFIVMQPHWGTWSVVNDTNNNKVYQIQQDLGNVGAVSVAGIGDDWADYTVEVDARIADWMPSYPHDDAGILIRGNLVNGSTDWNSAYWGYYAPYGSYIDAHLEGYFINLRHAYRRIEIQKWPNGYGNWYVAASSASVKPQLGQWYHVKITCTGANIKVFIDNVLVINFTDTAPIRMGRVGFMTWASRDQFDNLVVKGKSGATGDKGAYVGCNPPVGYVRDNSDCDDTRNNVNPGASEVCDGVDNDCNGAVDESLTQASSCGIGACAATGTETCTNGVWGGDTCTPGNPGVEVCDGVDNDCNGAVDEGLTQASSCGIGACTATGTETCTNGVWGGDTCVAGTPSAEVCNDGLDNDCDGQVDEVGCVSIDMVVSSLTAPAKASAGQSISATVKSTNSGANGAVASTTRLYLSTDAILDASDVVLGSKTVSALGANQTKSARVPVTIPIGAEAGTYYIIAKADAGGVIAENEETNNTRVVAIKVGPDLVVKILKVPLAVRAGQSISVTVKTSNIGKGAAGASTTLFNFIFFDADNPSDLNTTVEVRHAVPTLGPGKTNIWQVPVTIPINTAADSVNILAVADVGEVIQEAEEGNVAAASFNVRH